MQAMDIRQWLEDTAPPNHEAVSDFLQPQQIEPEQVTHKYRRKRKRPPSDSSIIIEPRHPDHELGKATKYYAHSSHEVRGAAHAVPKPQSLPSSQSSRPRSDEAPLKTYEKRRRHKTKPNHYEPKSKRHRKERDAHEDTKAQPKRRKSHRSGDGGRTTGLVQSFQLKNGPKNSRLTLKPETTAGLFRHGRASAQVAGRNAGRACSRAQGDTTGYADGPAVPDLVFNELRFLQKPKDHQDEMPRDDVAQPKKDGRRRQHQDEISAYFAAQRPDTAHTPGRDHRKSVAQAGQQRAHHDEHPPPLPKKQPNNPPVDLPEKPFLGFGSKGVQPDGKDVNLTSNSYYTGSESAPRSQFPRLDDPLEAVLQTKQHHRRSQQGYAGEAHLRDGPPRPSSLPEDEREAIAEKHQHESGTWHQSRRSEGAALVEVYQAPVVSKEKDERHRSATRTTSQSLPRHPYTENVAEKPKEVDHRQHQETSISYHTSDILNIQSVDPHVARTGGETLRDGPEVSAYDKENMEPRSSTPTSKLLRQAQQAVAHAEPRNDLSKPHSAYLTKESIGDVHRIICPDSRHEGHAEAQVRTASPSHAHAHAPDQVLDTQYTVSVPARYGTRPSAELSSRGTPQKRIPSIGLRERHLQSASGLRQAQTSTALPIGSSRQSRPPHHYLHDSRIEPGTVGGDDEMLDNGMDMTALESAPNYVYANTQQAEELVYGLRSDRAAGFYEAQSGQPDRMHSHAPPSFVSLEQIRSDAPRLYTRANPVPTRTPPVRGLSLERELRSERSASAVEHTNGDTLDDFAGFWKPHKLY